MKKYLDKLKAKWKNFRWYQKTLSILAIIILLHYLYVILLIFIFPPITITQIQGLMSTKKFQRDYVSYTLISKNAVLAVMGAEDQLFAEHHGFDMESIEKAMEYNHAKKGKKVRGASTISQQVAKNVFLWQNRSWIRKGLEVYFTLLIEVLWSKKRIMEMYLNVVEMGDGIYGIEAASRAYFKISAAQLNAEQASMIAAALPNPKKYKVMPSSSWVRFRAPWVQLQISNLKDDPEIQNKLLR